MSTVVLLGPQRFTPTLGAAVARVGVEGRLASVTAGWQEREDEDLELHEHLGERTVNLMLYARGEDVFERDPELFRAHRERQGRLRELQELYRARLAHASAAWRELYEREERSGAARAGEGGGGRRRARASTPTIWRGCGRSTRSSRRAWRPLERPAVARHRAHPRASARPRRGAPRSPAGTWRC